MTQYAAFDSTIPDPSAVIGWYDTEEVDYPNLPPSSDLLELTSDQWANRMTGPWAVVAGELVTNVPPPQMPVPPQPYTLADAAAVGINGGLVITLTGSVTLSATLFPTDAPTQTKLAAVTTTITATGAFPGGASTYPMKDKAGGWHTFTVPQYLMVAGALGAYVAALDLVIDGNPMNVTSLPSPRVTLAV